MAEKTNKIKNKPTPLGIVLLVFLCLYVVLLLAPLVWAFLSSLRDPWFYRMDSLWWIKGKEGDVVFFDNYKTIGEIFWCEVTRKGVGTYRVGMWSMFGYSLLYAIGCSFTASFIPCITAYCCSKFPCRLSKIVVATVIVCLSLPIVGSLPSEIRVVKFLGLYDRLWSMWVMKANFLGLYFLVFYAAFKGVSNTYSEAAKIDGAGNFRIFFGIIMPLVKNTFFTVMLIKFIEFWNDYQNPLIYMNSYPTIAIGLYSLLTTNDPRKMASTGYANTDPQRMAAAMAVLFPILIVFIAFQKKLLGDLTIGGVKG